MCNQNIKTVNSNESEQVKIIMKLKMFNNNLEYHVEKCERIEKISKQSNFMKIFTKIAMFPIKMHQTYQNIIYLKKNVKIDQKG